MKKTSTSEITIDELYSDRKVKAARSQVRARLRQGLKLSLSLKKAPLSRVEPLSLHPHCILPEHYFDLMLHRHNVKSSEFRD